MKPKIVDSGRVFGSDHWYNFYCGKCGRTINMNYTKEDRLKCDYCGETIEYCDDKKEAI